MPFAIRTSWYGLRVASWRETSYSSKGSSASDEEGITEREAIGLVANVGHTQNGCLRDNARWIGHILCLLDLRPLPNSGSMNTHEFSPVVAAVIQGQFV